MFPSLAALSPVMNGVGGNIASIKASRLTTLHALKRHHAGILVPSISPREATGQTDALISPETANSHGRSKRRQTTFDYTEVDGKQKGDKDVIAGQRSECSSSDSSSDSCGEQGPFPPPPPPPPVSPPSSAASSMSSFIASSNSNVRLVAGVGGGSDWDDRLRGVNAVGRTSEEGSGTDVSSSSSSLELEDRDGDFEDNDGLSVFNRSASGVGGNGGMWDDPADDSGTSPASDNDLEAGEQLNLLQHHGEVGEVDLVDLVDLDIGTGPSSSPMPTFINRGFLAYSPYSRSSKMAGMQVDSSGAQVPEEGVDERHATVILFLLTFPTHLCLLFLLWGLGCGHLAWKVEFFVIYQLAAALQIMCLLYLASWLVGFFVARGKDPDNFVFPYLTACGDLVGMGVLSVAFLLLSENGWK